MKQLRKGTGFTLIEICVAIAIVALGILTAVSILAPALQWAGDAKRDFTAGDAALSAIAYLNSGQAMGGTVAPYTHEFGAYHVSSTTKQLTSASPVALEVTLKVKQLRWDTASSTGGYLSVKSDDSDVVFQSIVNISLDK